jgi:hypothetical protein
MNLSFLKIEGQVTCALDRMRLAGTVMKYQ